MQRERYPGETAGLRNFLAGLQPIVERELGAGNLLHHAIRRALRTGSLADLRRARQMFNMLPRERRRAISDALVAAGRAARRSDAGSAEGGPWIVFDGGGSADPRVGPAIGLARSTEPPPHGLRVLIRPGTLPSVAADTLRRIAQTIERDRRLLSGRFWFGERDTGSEGG